MFLFKKKEKEQKVVYLDIDGVFNALSVLDPNNRVLISHDWGTWQISNENVEFLKYLDSNCKCMWISTWLEESNEINKFIGIKPFKFVQFSKKSEIIDQIKSKKLKKGLIIDDELTTTVVDYIQPNPATGLDEKDRKNIKKWLENE